MVLLSKLKSVIEKSLFLQCFLMVLVTLYFINLKFENDELNDKIKYIQNKRINEINRRIDSLISYRNKEYSELLLRKKATQLSGIEIPDKFNNKHIKKVFDECKRNNLPPRLVFRLIKAESNFRKNAVSSAGAQGFFQIMPATYRGYSKKLNINKHNEMSNIEVGTFYLKTLHDYFDRRKYLSKDEKWRLTILSYNYGIGRVINNRERFLGSEFDNYKYLNYILS